MEKRITVFTPTYNRAHLLHNCYESLLAQSNKQFKWLIIDDGSSDNTKKVVDEWIKENKIEITYVYKENGGLHTGYNKAIELLDTELSVCIDSDDWLAEEAIERILTFWDANKEEDCAGLIGLDVKENGEIVGQRLPNIKKVDPMILTEGPNIGDKKYVIRTDVYTTVAPMPVFKGEKNFNPHYMVLKLSANYKFLVYNEPLCIVDYQNDGMSANIFKQYLNSPRSFQEYRRLIISLPNTSFKYVVKQTIHYVSSSIIIKDNEFIKKSPKKLLTILMSPFGYLLYLYIKKNSNTLYKVK